MQLHLDFHTEMNGDTVIILIDAVYTVHRFYSTFIYSFFSITA